MLNVGIGNTSANPFFYQNTADANGGAIASEDGGSGEVNINLTQFNNNQATAGDGGAIYSTDPMTFTTLQFTSNTATGSNGSGGAGGAVEALGTLNDSSTTYTSNSVTGGNGGAIDTENDATLTSDTFNTNTAAVDSSGNGGSGGTIEAAGSGTFNDPNNTYKGNTVNGGNGGAIDATKNSPITLETFLGNTANVVNGKGGNGGAIANENNNQMEVVGCFFGGTAVGDGNVANSGGAIENFGTLTVTFEPKTNTASSFFDNVSATNGGAIDSNAGAAGGIAGQGLKVYSATFGGNTAKSGTGGAINTADNIWLDGDYFIPDPNGQKNSSTGSGGAVNAANSADPTRSLTVTNSTFTNNVSSGGGGGGAIFTAFNTDVEFSQFTGNQARDGGAMFYSVNNQNNPATPLNSSLTVNGDTFTTNTPVVGLAGDGGEISSDVTTNSGTITESITSGTFNANGNLTGIKNNTTIEDGGGVSILQTTSGNGSASASLTNDTFFQNKAAIHGGGLALFLTNNGTGTNTVALTSLTVNGNQAGTDSGGLFVSAAAKGVVTADNNIFDGNTVTAVGYKGPVDVTLTNAQALIDKGYNLVGLTDTMFTAKTDISNNNPGLANALANNNALPGYPQTLALANTSPGYEKGDPHLAGQTDERGRIRLAGKVSVGAEDPDAQ